MSSLKLRLLFDPTLSTISLAPITNYLDLGNSFLAPITNCFRVSEKTAPSSSFRSGFLRRNSVVRSSEAVIRVRNRSDDSGG